MAVHQVQPRRRRHRGGPGRGAADLRPADGRPARRRLPGRGGRELGVDQRRGLDRRPDRRHRELPLRHPALRGLHRGRRSTATRSPGWCVNVESGERFTATKGGGSFQDGVRLRVGSDGVAAAPVAAAGRHRLQLRRRREGQADRRGLRDAARGPRRPPDGIGGPRPVLGGLRAGSTPTSRRASTSGTWPPGGLVATEAGARLEKAAGVGGNDCFLCAPGGRVRRVPGPRSWPDADFLRE